MAAVPDSLPSQKSTTVRSASAPWWLRAAFASGSLVMPQATVAQAARLFGTPMRSSHKRALAADPGDGRLEWLDQGDTRLATYVWGDPRSQPWVLFVHGWSSFGLRCLPWMTALRQAGYAFVSYDQPQHGRSEGGSASVPGFASALTHVARQHGRPAAVIAHSMGGAAATYALAQGLEAERAILIAPAADMRAAGERFAGMVGLAQSLVGPMFAGFERALGVSVDDIAAHRHVPTLGLPALVVHDLADTDVPWHEGEAYARLWPRARLLSTTGMGHHRIAADPLVIAAALRFLAGETVGERVVSSPNLPFGLA